ncbi:MAG TPA: glycoside hydrolase family 20 zincin-like fold domain-containing protein, partial [Planctomycetota bacterium]|nr:glycoside hydrolase family 20 zincin-like fold domain-containing protein [Planctomycetota bacterium]
PDPDAGQIVPRPRTMEEAEGWFIIGPGTRIVAQPDAQARKVAEQIREEIHDRWRIEVPVTEEPAAAETKLDDVVYVGQPRRGALAERLRREEQLEIATKPQAYALRASPRGVVVLGGDDDGLYWGVQSLMMACRWHSSRDPKQNGLGVRCMKIEDWPATLDRSLFFTESTLFGYVPSEIPRLLRNCQLQSRFKWNATYTAIEGPALAWPTGLVAKVSRRIRDQHHMEIRPMLLGHPRCSPCGWDKLVRASKDYSVVECDPDEAPEELGSALNLCPVNPRSYDLIFARIDELRELCGSPGKIWLGGLVLPWAQSGARWAVCRNCRKTGKSKDELYALFAEKIARHLRERQMTGVLEPWDVAFGDRDDLKWKRAIVAADVKSLPTDLEYILPDDGSPGFKDFIRSRLLPSRTANGPLDWPSVERINLDGMATDLGTASHLTDTPFWAGHPSAVERMWYGADKCPREKIDFQDLRVWGNSWRFRRDFPSWRAGDRPGFFLIDLRPFVNHTGQATGRETLEPGRMPAIDLRYVPTGKQVLSGVAFDIIDPAKNNGKCILTLGRPTPGSTHPKDAAAVIEGAGPIPVERKLASLAFLRAGWQASPQWRGWHAWLFPTCRVTYEDDTWLPVDCFRPWDMHDFWNNPYDSPNEIPLLDRIGWKGNCPGGSWVMLKVNEWVNPYPAKVIKHLEFFTPAYEQGDDRKMVNSQCQTFIAITGVEPIEQDFNYWSKRADRPPLLPPIKAPARPGVVLQRCGAVGGANTRYAVTLKGPRGETKSRLELTPGATWATEGGTRASGFSSNDCGQVGCRTEYKPFGVVQVLEPAVKLCRVELRGPTCGYYHGYYTLGRNHRLDVTLEVSEDGETWRKVGELRGILGDADFLPMEFDPVPVRKLRFTATAEPYHEDYSPGVAAIDYPYFVWRLIAPTEGGEDKK